MSYTRHKKKHIGDCDIRIPLDPFNKMLDEVRSKHDKMLERRVDELERQVNILKEKVKQYRQQLAE